MTDAYFEKAASTYLDRSGRGLWGHFRRREKAVIFDFLQPQPGESLLELGCGAGFYARKLYSDFGMQVTGVDVCPSMIRQLENSGVTTILARAENLQLRVKFDKILAAGVFEFVPDALQVFEKCAQFLKPGGRLVLLAPRLGFSGWVYEAFHKYWGCSVYMRSSQAYREHGSKCGLNLIDQRNATVISTAMLFQAAPPDRAE